MRTNRISITFEVARCERGDRFHTDEGGARWQSKRKASRREAKCYIIGRGPTRTRACDGAQALLLVEEGHSQASVARLLHTSTYRVHVWQERFAIEDQGLVDHPRGERPHALSDADRAFLEAALERGSQVYKLPTMIWSIRELLALLEREQCIEVSVDTVHQAVHDWAFARDVCAMI